MSDDRDLIESFERLEAASRRARPLLILGLLGILGGFVILIVYINGLRADAEARAAQWQDTAQRLQVSIEAAQLSARMRDARAGALLGMARSQTVELAQVQAKAEAPTQDLPAVPPPTPADAWAAASIAASNPALSIRGLTDLFERGFGVNDMIDAEQNRPIHLAAERCGERVVSWLLSRGADASIQNHWRDTPLRIATIRCGADSPTARALRAR